MINNVTVVGRIVETPSIRELEKGQVVSNVTLAVTRPFKNMEGNYDTDFIRFVLWEGIAQSTCEYCKKGDIIGIRGRIAPKTQEMVTIDNDEKVIKKITVNEIIAERVAFIHASRKSEDI